MTGDVKTVREEKIKRICLTCGKYFYKDPTLVRRGEGLYCNRTCFNKRKELKVKCLQCGKEFKTKPSIIKKNVANIVLELVQGYQKGEFLY